MKGDVRSAVEGDPPVRVACRTQILRHLSLPVDPDAATEEVGEVQVLTVSGSLDVVVCLSFD